MYLNFSHNSNYLAVADADYCVSLYKCTKQKEVEGEDTNEEWNYIGKYRSHSKPVTGLLFFENNGESRLLSISEDRQMVEYDLLNSLPATGLLVKEIIQVEQYGQPTSLCYVKGVNGASVDNIVVANDQYKLKLWHTQTKQCCRTLLGPTYGGPLNK